MSAVYVDGAGTWALQPGYETETTPEGLTTLTETWKGPSGTAAETWRTSTKPKGSSPTVTGYSGLVSIAAPRLVNEGAFSTGYVVYQSTPSGDGTSENDLDVSYTHEERTVKIQGGTGGDGGKQYLEITYLSPIVTASYVRASKPTNFRFDGLLDEEAEIINFNVVGRPWYQIVEESDYSLIKQSVWTERRQSGGVWYCTEQHSSIVVNYDD